MLRRCLYIGGHALTHADELHKVHKGSGTMITSIHEWQDVDIQEVAQLTYEVLQHSPVTRRKSRTVEGVVSWLNALEFPEFFTGSPVVVLARERDTLIGWLMLCTTGSKTAEVVPWGIALRPVIAPDHDRIRIGVQLVEKGITWAKEAGVEAIVLRADRNPGREEFTWYESLGFHVREETVFMNYSITGDEKDVHLPEGFERTQILKVDREDLYQCYYDTFKTGQSPFFFDQNEKEKRDAFNLLFEMGCADGDTSLAIVKDSQVVGFSFVKPYGDEGNVLVDWIGIHPEYRRRGLGEGLLRYIMKTVAEQGYATLSLSCAVGNTRAFDLYHKCGWEVEGGETIFSLNV